MTNAIFQKSILTRSNTKGYNVIMSSGNLHIRLPAKLKKEAQRVIEASGLDVSSAIRLFFSHVVARRTIPLQFLTVNGIPAALEDELLDIASDQKNMVGPFTSKEALLKSLYAKD